MGKNKVKDYLPLLWCKKFTDTAYKLFGENYEPEDIKNIIISFSSVAPQKLQQALIKYPYLKEILGKVKTGEYSNEILQDLDTLTLITSWGKNKQVYKFDKDFTDELIRTDNICLVKNMFDYLPYSTIYIDISDNKNLCNALGMNGFFVSIEKVPKEWLSDFINNSKDIKDFLRYVDKWCIHISKVSDELFYNDMLFFPNEDIVLRKEDLEGECSVPIYDKDGLIEVFSFDGLTFKKLILQTLIYLSSTEPDIDETQQSKETYRAPSAVNKKPKNKFSEIRTWEVGVRYGSAFRKWKSESSHDGVSTGTGSKKRPHTRRAHWSYYWYGKRDGERVRRPKWIAETFVGVDKNNAKEQPVVIHETINNN